MYMNSLALLKNEKPELVINVALPYQDLTIMDACLDAVCIIWIPPIMNLLILLNLNINGNGIIRKNLKKQGLMALLGSGFDPGATNVFTAYLAKHYFDEIQNSILLM